VPKLTSVTIAYSVGFKANIGDFSNASTNFEKSETWNVMDLTAIEVAELEEGRFQRIKEDLDKRVEVAHHEIMGTKPETSK